MKTQILDKAGFPKPLGIILILIILSSQCFPVSLFAQSASADSELRNKEKGSKGIPVLFDDDEIINITIATDLNKLVQDISDSAEYHRAILSYILPGEDTISLNVSIKTRGNFRKDKKNCDFPPLRIKFSKKEAKNTIFKGQDWIKLVTHCRTGESEYEQLVFQEYLVYKLYNLLTTSSFRVRMLDVTYIDIWDPRHSVNSYAFLLERPKNMATRNGADIINVDTLSLKEVELDNYTLLSLFQYMIINNDWAVSPLKNIELISTDPSVPPILVPYDFDWAGIVGAPYRITTDPDKDITSDRFYRGVCRTEDDLIPYLNLLKSTREEIYNVYRNFDLQDRKHKTRTLKILDDFYKIINHPEAWKKEFMQVCGLD